MTVVIGNRRVPAAADDGAPLLQLQGICKSFGGTQALHDVSISLQSGEVLALLGENGAGKSTLIKILAGVHVFDNGEIFYDGQDVSAGLAELPIAFIHQDLGLIEWMTVLENVCLTRGYARSGILISWRKSRAAAVEALMTLGIDLDPGTRVRQLGCTEKSLVAIARALSTDARIVVMDEPTASLPADEVARLFDAIRRLRARGVGVIYVSHRLDEIFAIADRVVVLRDGCVAGQGLIAGLSPASLIEMIIGRRTNATDRIAEKPEGPVALSVERLLVEDIGPVTFAMRAGEVLALTGLRGAGHETIGRALFGLMPLDSGSVFIGENEAQLSSPETAIRQGIRFVSSDRGGESVMSGFSVVENLFLNPRAAGRKLFGRIRHGRERADARQVGKRIKLSPNDPIMQIEALSGGNQQKVVLGRWLHLRGKVLILEDPTAGIDVGAKESIYRLLHGAAASGLAVLLVSTDFVEVATLCRRALVFSRGRIVCELVDEALSGGSVLSAASMTSVR